MPGVLYRLLLKSRFRTCRTFLLTSCAWSLVIFIYLHHQYSGRSFVRSQQQLIRAERIKEIARPIKESIQPLSSKRGEKRHIAFLKVHKAASSTIQNILFRFGYQRNLTFVLAKTSNTITYGAQPHDFRKRLIPLADNNTKYDIICNHVSFNAAVLDNLLYTDSFYMAIVRNPLELFISSAYYYKFVYPLLYLKRMHPETFIHDLITNPRKYEARSIMYSATFNYMAIDFGFRIKSIQDAEHLTPEHIANFVSGLGNKFKLVMIVERFHESLILMKRYLKWTFNDILYVKQNEFKPRRGGKVDVIHGNNVTKEDKDIFRRRNKIDVAIYDYFSKRFDEQVAVEEGFQEEVNNFRRVLKHMGEYCGVGLNKRELVVNRGEWNPEFNVTAEDCRLMKMNELTFNRKLQAKQRRLLGS